jgi:hypothetical protein
MGIESPRAYAIEFFCMTEPEHSKKGHDSWEKFVEKSRALYIEDKELLKEFRYFNDLQDFAQGLMKLYFQECAGIGWSESYNQVDASDYLVLLEYIREQVKEVLNS